MTCGTPNRSTRVRIAGVLVALVAVASLAIAAAPAGATSATADGSAFVVAVDADGDAEVTLRLPVDLGAEPDRETLARIERNRSAVAEQFRERLAGVAERTESSTGRSMAVSEASVRVTAGNATTIVELTATWEGLAAVEGDRLVVTEPFASGFQPAHRFVVRPPEGYTVASVNPSPDERSDGAVVWPAGADLSGFQAAFAPESGADADATAAGPMPGFGLGAGIVAVLAIGALGRLVVRR